MIAPLNPPLPLSNQRSRRAITQQAITQTLLTAGANDQPFRSVASLVVGQMQPCDLRPFRMGSASFCLHFSEPGVVSIAGNAVKRRCSKQSSSRHFWAGGVFPCVHPICVLYTGNILGNHSFYRAWICSQPPLFRSIK